MQSRRRAGHIAKDKGQFFESILATHACHDGFVPLRIPDGCRQVRGPKGLALIRVKSPFDFVLVGSPNDIFLDAKATESNTFSYSKINQDQVAKLRECERFQPAGYVIWFESIDQVAFFSASKMSKIAKRQSVRPIDGLILGPLKSFRLKPILESWILDSIV